MMRTKRNKFVWPKLSIKSLLKQGRKKEEFAAEEELESESEPEDDDCLRRHSFSIPSFEFDRWSSAGQHRRHSSALSVQNDLSGGINAKQNFRIFIGTWNVGGRRPQDKVNLEQWLTLTEPADIYVIGFQEVVPLNAGNVLGAEDKSSAEQWLRLIQNVLNNNKHCDPATPPSRKAHMASDGMRYFVSEMASSNKRADPFLLTSDHNLEFSFPLPEEMLLDESFGRSESGISFRSHTSDDKETSTGCDSSPPLSPMVSARAIACKTRSNKSCYTLIASKRMVGIFLCVWVRSNLRGYVQHVKLSSVGCGIMGYLGNKGSISVSLCLHETTFCFICSHLTSGEKEGDELRRNYDVSVILKRTRFRRSPKCSGKSLPNTILDHDRVLWFGDLNYRLALSSTSTKLLLARGDWETLLERDQLHIEQRAGRVFKGWHEGKICFPPTYKYRMGSDSYAVERLKFGDKRRTPAWCDRILWYGKGLRQLEYVRAESNFSDHRPVYAVFSAEVEVPDSRKLRDFLV